ncbi:Ion transport protein-domain-containing protein [Lentinula edodes]|nr:Ion transport protein-domain-containing protein [Lentinula edodes]
MSRNPTERWREEFGETDMERTAGALSPRAKRRTVRYNTSPSPLKKTGSALKTVSKSLRRASLRVVNFGNSALETQVRLPDDDSEKNEETADDELLPDFSARLPIRDLVHIPASHSLTLPDGANVGDTLPPHVTGYFHEWEDYVLFVLFVLFTLEAFARICVSGFILAPDISASTFFTSPLASPADITTASQSSSTNNTFPRQLTLASNVGGPLSRGLSITERFNRLNRNLKRPFELPSSNNVTPEPQNHNPSISQTIPVNPVTEKIKHVAQASRSVLRDPPQPTFLSSVLRSDRKDPQETLSLPFKLSINQSHNKTMRSVPYLRQSWGRIDFVAILGFWTSFILAMLGLEDGAHHIGVFRALSVIRTARLLTITSGTTTIIHSLKTARPLLANVALFVLFAMILFSYVLNIFIISENPTCPRVIGIQSFKGSLRRNCFLLPVNGETQQQLSDQFCGGHINDTTLVANSYILLNGSVSEYTAKGYICPLGQICQETENPEGNIESFDTIYYAALQIVVTASANSWSGLMYNIIDAEYFVSSLFFIVCVIVLNFWLINLFVAVITNTFSAIRSETQKSAFGAASLPVMEDERDDGWAAIDRNKPVKKNIAKTIYDYTRWCWVLLALASLTLQATRTASVSSTHAEILSFGELGITFAFDLEIVVRMLATLPDWRSFFVRAQTWLDVILAVGSSIIQIPVIKDSTVYSWFTIFQLMRFYRVILEVPRMKPLLLSVFGNMYGLTNMSLFLILVNFLAAFLSSQLLRGDMSSNDVVNFGQLYNAFLAVYQVFSSENWTDVLYNAGQAELQLGQTVLVVLFISLWLLHRPANVHRRHQQKRSQQATHYWSTHQVQAGKVTWVRRLNPYRWFKANPVKVQVENLPSSLVLPMQQALVQDYTSGTDSRPIDKKAVRGTAGAKPTQHYTTKSLSALQKLFGGDERADDVPLATLKHNRSETLGALGDEETERHLELLASVNPEAVNSNDLNDALFERRAQKADFIRDHPTIRFDDSANDLYNQLTGNVSSVIIFLAVIGGIVTEIIATPVYRRNYYATNGRIRGAWFDLTEATFGFVLLLEFIIKIIADGFLFTPNAYIRSIWNVIDFVILSGILVNVTTGLIFIGGLSRFTRSSKALRALRLITLFDRMRNSFQSLIISGASRIFDAALLAILYMVPYAVWGLNIFAGKLNTCNDSNAAGMDDCTNEYVNSYINDAFGYPVPRVWDNPAPSTKFSFDNFGSSLLMLFQILSLEGWVDVMQAAASAVGDGLQPQTNASQWNALFFLIYNLLGGVVILTLFVSIVIGNFKSRTGTALLTQPQREWIGLQKLFKRQRPSKRPQRRPVSGPRAWGFDRAVHKHGWWSRCMTVLFTIHVIVLMTQTYTSTTISESMRNDFFLTIIFIYMIDVSVRLYGFGWKSFRANGWNLFDILVTMGSFATTFIARFGNIGFLEQQLQKLFLVLVAFKASLPSILTLLLLWLILFMFFAILDVEVFGLTKWQTGEDRGRNYSSISSALVMLAFMSTGEGWNQYMHDYALVYPRCSNSSNQDVDSDCGSFGWAFTLFIAWNLLSMYIFVNLFTGVVVDSFSYVFQASGGSRAITREEMRAFKKVWAEFASPQTGYLERSQFVPFFGKLSGVFEVRIYPAQYNIHNIAAACKASPSDNSTSTLTNIQPWSNLSSNTTPPFESAVQSTIGCITKRQSHTGRGISFTDMLLLLAHHKLIKDSDALRDLVIRTETNKLVTDLVNLDRVQSLLKMISLRRRFLAHMERKRASMYDPDIPAIVVDTMPETPPPFPSPSLSPSRPSSRDISTVGFSGWDNSAPSTPTPVRRTNFGSVQLDFGALGFGGSQFAQQQQSFPSLSS